MCGHNGQRVLHNTEDEDAPVNKREYYHKLLPIHSGFIDIVNFQTDYKLPKNLYFLRLQPQYTKKIVHRNEN